MSKQQEALQFLDDLDSLNTPSTSKPPPVTSGAAQPPNEAEALAFLDEITQKSSEPTRTTNVPNPQPRTVTPRTSSRISLRKGAEGISRSSSPAPTVSSHTKATSGSSSPGDGSGEASTASTAGNSGAGSWGWGSVWSSASAAVKQARNVVDEQVKNLPKNEQAKKWSEGMLEYVKNAQLDKLGQDLKSVGISTFTDILNVVAPPIAEHEVIQVWLSHDMRGYDGVESLVYQALAKVMEQVDGGDLVVNKGDESRPKDASQGRDLGVVEGFDAAFKLAKANIDEMIKNNSQKAPTRTVASTSNPTTYSAVYLRIQPYSNVITTSAVTTGSDTSSPESSPSPPTHLQFLLHLSSPSHALTHTTTSQAVPSRWIDAFQAEDAEGKGGDINSWVEDVLVDVLRLGVEVIGQEYVGERMGWGKRAEISAAIGDATRNESGTSQEKEGVTSPKTAET